MVERGVRGMCRWTGGQAELQLPTMNSATVLEIHATTAGMAYPLIERSAA
jgi:hypothetical protein